MAKKRKIVILTGAGAAIPWGAPSTKELTDKIIEDKEFVTISDKPIGEYFYGLLKSYYGSEWKKINFEIILNLVEELFDFYSSYSSENPIQYKSCLPVVFNVKEDIERDILKFEDKDIYKLNHRIYESRNKKSIFWSGKYKNPNYFRSVIRYLINIVIGEIYEYDNEKRIKSSSNTTLNDCFVEFLKYFENDTVRFYTINYDRLPLVICDDNKFFNGCSEPLEENFYRFDTTKILSDENINCYYNLHGSIHYKLMPTGEWVYTPSESNSCPEDQNESYNQPGKPLIFTPILTGLDKNSRILNKPNFEFLLRFFLDCHNADLLMIIGYSYSDIHINRSIGRYCNDDNKKLIMIDSIEYKNQNSGYPFKWGNFNNILGNLTKDYFPNTLPKQDWMVSPKKRSYVFCDGFENFLRSKEWKFPDT